jgi:hypothetical protein
MQILRKGVRGLILMLSLNWDRIIYLATILLALMAGAVIPSLL